jgi:hypothetical protein
MAGDKGKWKRELREAIASAADEQLEPGDHEVRVVEIEAKVTAAKSPGQVHEYRIKVEKIR